MNIRKLKLIESYLDNSIWDNLYRLNLNDLTFWKEEFKNFFIFLNKEIEEIEVAKATWENTYLKLKKVELVVYYFVTYFSIYKNIHLNKNSKVSAFASELETKAISIRDEVLNNLKLISKIKDLQSTKISIEKKSILSSWLNCFFNSNPCQKTRRKHFKISSKLELHTKVFENNNKECFAKKTNVIHVSKVKEHLLECIDDDYLVVAAKLAKSFGKDGWSFVLEADFTKNLIMMSENRTFRQMVYNKYQKINKDGAFKFKNSQVLKSILGEKHKIAKLIGKDNYAELVLSKYILNDTKSAYKYLSLVEKQIAGTMNKINKSIQELAVSDNIENPEAWDKMYYYKKITDKEYSVDNCSENISEDYFSFEYFLPKLLKQFETIFDVSIVKKSWSGVNNKKVFAYDIKDNQSERTSVFIIDPFEREEEQCFYCFELSQADTINDGFVKPSIQYIRMHLKKESRTPLYLGVLVAIIHEFGHAFNSFFSQINDHVHKPVKFSWDLIELPSQFLEHLAYDYSFMKNLSSHKNSHRKIPEKLFVKMVEREQKFSVYNINQDIQINKSKLFMHENFKPYSTKNLHKENENCLAKKGIMYNVAEDEYMTNTDYKNDYGPAGFVYLYSAQLAYQLYTNREHDLRKIFTTIFNPEKKNEIKVHMDKYFDLNHVDIYDFVKKGLPINVYK